MYSVYEKSLPQIENRLVFFKTEFNDRIMIGKTNSEYECDFNLVKYFCSVSQFGESRFFMHSRFECTEWEEFNPDEYEWFNSSTDIPLPGRRLIIADYGFEDFQKDNFHIAHRTNGWNERLEYGNFMIEVPYNTFNLNSPSSFTQTISITKNAPKWCYFPEEQFKDV